MMPPTDTQLPVQAAPSGGGTVSLNTLIEYGVQRTYHELSVLSELLIRKTDTERKIEIVQFASKTRQLFVRLLSLVKWANSATKVDRCGDIVNFLEQQSMLLVETADMLAKMSRDTLINARLPNFSLPCAIDVLTTGCYPRLPTCIRDKIIPPDPITASEKISTLHRLNQVIQYRLVSSDLPLQMRRLKIENGRVKFLVEHEFEVTMTLMGDSPTIPWRLLDIDFLVEDHETGDGKSLVHSLQVNYIHQLSQSRLLNNDRPLHDVYKVLHSFCQSLQLEVLHSQSQKLLHDRLGDCIRVEDYSPGRRLVMSYWRDQTKRERGPETIIYKLSIHVSEQEESKPLQITHTPPIPPDHSRKVGLAIKSDHLSIEKLLMQTIQARTIMKLKDLTKDIQKYITGNCEIIGTPPVLHIPIIYPCMSSEWLRIAIHLQRGYFLASVPSFDNPVLQDIEDCLNCEQRGMDKHIVRLRMHLCLIRCEKSVQNLPAVYHRQLPIINMVGHQLETLSACKLFVRVPKQVNFWVVVEMVEGKPKIVKFNYYLLETSASTGDGNEDEFTDEAPSRPFLQAGRLITIDIQSLTHGPHTKLYDFDDDEMDNLTRKRKLLLGDLEEPPVKKMRGSHYFISELTYLIANFEEKIPFIHLGKELRRRGLSHSGVTIDGEGACMCLTLMDLPSCEGIPEKVTKDLRNNLLSCKFRAQGKPNKNWIVEFIFANCPLKTTNQREGGPVQQVYYVHELLVDNFVKVVSDLLDFWFAIAKLYGATKNFARIFNDSRTGLHGIVEVKSYNYKRLVLAYGPKVQMNNGMLRNHVMNLSWKHDLKEFCLTLGTYGPSSTINCHVIVQTQLQQQLNMTGSIEHLVQVLHDTWSPISSICQLTTSPLLGAGTHPKTPMLSFTIIPQSPTHIRIAFRNMNCIDVHYRGGKLVAVRDGAYSLFDTSKVIEGFTPTQGLKAFLNMFVDESVKSSHTRRRSTTEDDNPPSPVGMDSMDVFMAQPSTGSPATRQRQDPSGAMRYPMTPPSNPHTPASPSTSRISQSGGYASPAASSFHLSSPPTLPPQVTPSPSAAMMSTPSPSTLLSVGSPVNPVLHVPSPGSFVPAPSPQSLGIHMPSPATSTFINPQGLVDGGSPFSGTNLAMPSPGSRNWPGSPSIQSPSPASHGYLMSTSPRNPALHSPQMPHHRDVSEHNKLAVLSPPSRILPQRSWAASIPTLLSHDAFSTLLTPGLLHGGPHTLPASPLERFLGCVYLRRHMPRVVQTEEMLTAIPHSEPGLIMFKVETLQFRVSLNPGTLQSLHMKVSTVPEYNEQWVPEEMQILETFFDRKVACPPYKVNALTAFGRLLGAPARILKDCIQVMRLELMPPSNLKWSVQWCLTYPPGAMPAITPPGTPAIVIKNKMIMVLQFTRIGLALPSGSEPQSIVIPLLYDLSINTIQLLDSPPSTSSTQTPAQTAISGMLRRFTDFNKNLRDCAIFPAIQELMTHLVIPV